MIDQSAEAAPKQPSAARSAAIAVKRGSAWTMVLAASATAAIAAITSSGAMPSGASTTSGGSNSARPVTIRSTP